MTKTFDELMKVLEEKGILSEEDGSKIIKEHGALTDDEKKDLAAAIKMKKALTKDKPAEEKKDEAKDGDKKDDKPAEEKKDEPTEISMDDYLQALSVLDADGASAEDKEKATKIKEKFESQ